jgi:hypothetical protein
MPPELVQNSGPPTIITATIFVEFLAHVALPLLITTTIAVISMVVVCCKKWTTVGWITACLLCFTLGVWSTGQLFKVALDGGTYHLVQYQTDIPTIPEDNQDKETPQ